MESFGNFQLVGNFGNFGNKMVKCVIFSESIANYIIIFFNSTFHINERALTCFVGCLGPSLFHMAFNWLKWRMYHYRPTPDVRSDLF